MAETNRIYSASSPDTTDQEGAVFIRTEYDEKTATRNVISRSITTTKEVQTAIIKALNDMGIKLTQSNPDAESPEPMEDYDTWDTAQTVSVIQANTEGISDRFKVEPPLSSEQITLLDAGLGNLARLYAYTDGLEPTQIMPKTVEQASTEQIAA